MQPDVHPTNPLAEQLDGVATVEDAFPPAGYSFPKISMSTMSMHSGKLWVARSVFNVTVLRTADKSSILFPVPQPFANLVWTIFP